MQLYQIRNSLTICETGNVTHAAKKCHVSQPSMSRGVRKLEEEPGDDLFSRDPNGVRLTPFGEEMLKICATARLNIIDAPGAELIEQMESGELDLCVSGYFHLPKDTDAHRLYDEKYVISFSKGHRFEAMKTVSVHELDAEPYVRRLGCELITTLPDMLPDARRPCVDVRYASRHENMVQTMILAGVGCSVHPETMPVHDGIYQRPIAEDEMQRSVCLLVNRKSPSQALMRRVVHMAQTHEGFSAI